MKKLSTWAKENNMTYRTAWLWVQNGTFPLKTFVSKTNRIFVVEDNNNVSNEETTYIYARVSTHGRKNDLNNQVCRCEDFCRAKGWTVNKSFKEIASGMNDQRKQLWKVINERPTRIVVENKDRLTRFGFNYIEQLLKKLGTEVVVVNKANEDREDLLKDLCSVIYSFCARLYGMRRAVKKAKLVQETLKEN